MVLNGTNGYAIHLIYLLVYIPFNEVVFFCYGRLAEFHRLPEHPGEFDYYQSLDFHKRAA